MAIKIGLQVIKMLALVVFIFAVCWLPYRAMVMYNSFATAIGWPLWDSDWLVICFSADHCIFSQVHLHVQDNDLLQLCHQPSAVQPNVRQISASIYSVVEWQKTVHQLLQTCALRTKTLK